MIMKDNKEDMTDWLINREDSIGYSDKYYAKTEKCMQCAKNMTCAYCTGLVKFSQIKGYGIPERREINENNK